MFNFHDFIMKGLTMAIGHQPDYWIINQAAGWIEKQVLNMDDLAAIDAAISAQYPAEPEQLPEEMPRM